MVHAAYVHSMGSIFTTRQQCVYIFILSISKNRTVGPFAVVRSNGRNASHVTMPTVCDMQHCGDFGLRRCTGSAFTLAICFRLPLSVAQLHRSVQYDSGSKPDLSLREGAVGLRYAPEQVPLVTLFASLRCQVGCQLSCVVVYRWNRTEISTALLNVM